MSAPPKENPLLASKGLSKRPQTEYAMQLAFQGWQREAARLLNEYFRSGNPRHLVAFCVRVMAMRVRLEMECA